MAKKQFFIESELVFAEKSTHGKFKDLEGLKFDKLTVLGFAGVSKEVTFWFCKCECGNIKKVQGRSLKSGTTKSCGCFQVEQATTHGHAGRGNLSLIYTTWAGMIARCDNPNHPYYADYGGRGIMVCDSWLIFENFLKDMGERPKGLSLDRKENDKGYYKENCRWATQKEQQNNKRSNHLLTYNGKTQTMTQWAEEIGVKLGTLWARIRKGWSVERAMTKFVAKTEINRL